MRYAWTEAPDDVDGGDMMAKLAGRLAGWQAGKGRHDNTTWGGGEKSAPSTNETPQPPRAHCPAYLIPLGGDTAMRLSWE